MQTAPRASALPYPASVSPLGRDVFARDGVLNFGVTLKTITISRQSSHLNPMSLAVISFSQLGHFITRPS